MYGIDGVDHLTAPGQIRRIIAGSYPSGPSSAAPPKIVAAIESNAIEAYNIPSGILFQLHRAAAVGQPGVLTEVGMDTFMDPRRHGGRMNARTTEDIVSGGRLRRARVALPAVHPRRRRDHPRHDRRRVREPHERGGGRAARRAGPGARRAQQRRLRDRPGQAPRRGPDAAGAGRPRAGDRGRRDRRSPPISSRRRRPRSCPRLPASIAPRAPRSSSPSGAPAR